MADIFSLAPEGQAWTDDKTTSNPARPEDYDPTIFQGAASAFPRGVAEGTIGLAQSAVGFSKRLISDPAFTDNVAPTVNMFRVLFPDADKSLNESLDSLSASLQQARGYVKPDAASQGTAAEVLNGLGQFAPAIGASIIGGPVVGGAAAFGSTYEQSYQDFLKKGVDEATARNLAAQQSSFNAIGMGLPAAVGTTLATRIASGVAINTAFGGVNRFSVGETLEDKGYSDLAKQYRVWDGQAIMIDAVLGGAFGGAHHLASRNAADTPAPPPENEAPIPAAEVQSVTGGDQPTSQAEAVQEPGPAAPQITYDSRVAELQDLAGQVLSRGDRKALTEEIHRAEYEIAQIGDQRQALRDQRVGNSSSRRIRNRELATLDQREQEINSRIAPSREALSDSTPGGRFYDARSDLSRLEQGIIPESMRGLVRESTIKPSDIDAAHTLNEGLYYDVESAPVLHGTNESINSHVAAMDEAARQLSNGQPVNIAMQARGLDGPVRPGLIENASEQHNAMQQVFDENGVRYEQPKELVREPAAPRENSAFSGAEDSAQSQASIDPDTGQSITSNSYDLLAARDMAVINPDLTITHPDTGKPVKLSDVLAEFDEQIQTVQKESKVYSVAAACFLRNP